MKSGAVLRGGNRVEGLSRRDFIKVGGAAGLAAGWASGVSAGSTSSESRRSVILIMMVGGPSQLETFDPKPDAPSEIRGPFGSIATSVPGVRVSEHLPRIAARMNRLGLIRTLHHDEAPIHETGLQLLQTGRLSREENEAPHFGAVAANRLGSRSGAAPFVVLPELVGPTGIAIPRGQGAGVLGRGAAPVTASTECSELRKALDTSRESESTAASYGASSFGRNCLQARRLVESGVRVVTINMAPSVFNQVSWDAHGSRPFSSLQDYKRELLPAFDQGFAALVEDLRERGLLDSTLVVATGEFGRNPRLNAQGGRDHWTGAWSALTAGGHTKGGSVIGTTDKFGGEPKDRPVHPAELVASIHQFLGVDHRSDLTLADGSSIPILGEVDPIRELTA